MKYIIILFIGLGTSLFGQKTNRLIIQSRVENNVIHTNWFPEDKKSWLQLMTVGYSISRQAVNADGTSIGQPIVLASKVARKEASWFEQNMDLEEGLMVPVQALLFDKNFDFPENDQMSALDMKYNYLVYESTFRPVIAEALGLGFTDVKVEQGARYRYIIKGLDGTFSGSVDITNQYGNFASVPEDYQPEFIFPDDNSLSSMQQLSKPFVLNGILGKGRPHIDSIILRWGPTTMEIWQNAMKDGYDIYRSSDDQDRKLIARVLPWESSAFTKIPLTDSMALLAASIVQAKGIPPQVSDMDFFEQSAMATNYFGFALYTADRSPLAAEVLGLRYVDKDVEFGKTYVYEIDSKRLQSTFPLQEVIVTNEYSPLLPPEGFHVSRGEKSVTLKWLADSDLTKYGSYVVERSEIRDSLYEVLTDPPLVFLNEPGKPTAYHTYKDSLSENGVMYFYRVRGNNAFGEWSDYAYGYGAGVDQTPPVAVSLRTGTYDKEKNEINISWQENNKAADLESYQVMVANDPDGAYSSVSPYLPLTDTSFVLKMEGIELDNSFYFVVVSRDSSGNEAQSIPRFVNVPDHTPPLPPPAIKAIIDSTGLVQVTWEDSPSNDTEGYWIYFSNNQAEELTAINDYLYKGNEYTWNVPVNSLTKNMYVCIKAEDENYNKSDASEIIKVRRTDKIPPAKAVMLPVEIVDDQIELTWVASSSEDLEGYVLFVKNKTSGDTGWTFIDTLRKDQITYQIKPDSFEQYYNYCLKAFDDFGNMSECSNEVQGKIPFPSKDYVVADLKIVQEKERVDITWNPVKLTRQTESVDVFYEIYKSSGESEPAFLIKVPFTQVTFSDENVKTNVLYNYAVRVKFENSWTGDQSEVKSILIKK